MSTTQSLQAIQSIVQRCLTSFELFDGRAMSCEAYDKWRHNHSAEIDGKSGESVEHNDLVFHLRLMATRGLSSCASLNIVARRPMVIHAVGRKHWKLASLLCRH